MRCGTSGTHEVIGETHTVGWICRGVSLVPSNAAGELRMPFFQLPIGQKSACRGAEMTVPSRSALPRS